MSDKNIHQKIKCFFSSFNIDRGSHNSGDIHGENLYIWAVERKKNHFSKTKIYFPKKTTPQLLGHIGLENMKVGEKANFGWLADVCLMHVDISS